MHVIRQLGIVSGTNLGLLAERRAQSMLMVLSIASAVAVLCCSLAMSAGLNSAMRSSARGDRVVVLRTGSVAELASGLTREQYQAIANNPEIRLDSSHRPLVAADAIAPLTLVERGTQAEVNVTLRGMTVQGLDVRPEIHVTEGRAYNSGQFEVLVGRRAQRQFLGLETGTEISAYGARWKIVGAFDADGSLRESELLTDANVLMNVSHRPVYQSVTAVLRERDALGRFEKVLTGNTSLAVTVFPEKEFLARESGNLDALLSFLAWVMSGIMSVGAAFVAANACRASIDERRREMATLRALGFAPVAVVGATLVESLLLAFTGGGIGAGFAWLIFNGDNVSTAIGLDMHQLVFELVVNLGVVLTGFSVAVAIGLAGSIPSAVASLRSSVVSDLRAN
jgi:putative ABC transport system permease protein